MKRVRENPLFFVRNMPPPPPLAPPAALAGGHAGRVGGLFTVGLP